MEVDKTNPVPKSLNPYIKLYKLNIDDDIHKSLKKQHQESDEGQFVRENQSNRMIEDTQTMRVMLERITVYECKQCYFCYTTERDYKLHIIKHAKPVVKTEFSFEKYSNKVKKYKCEDCDLSFVAESTLQAHAVVHRPFPHQCPCGIGYNKRDDLIAHKRLVHPELKKETVWEPLTSYTGKKFKSEHCIKSEHVTPQSNAIQTKLGVYKPKTPPKVQTKKRKKKSEQQIKNYTGVTLPDVEYKTTVSDDGRKKYVCLICDKEVLSYRSLQHHNLTHTGEKPFKCKICGKGFSQHGAVNTHILSIHVGTKFECHICKKRLGQKAALSLHMRQHTGEKPYHCEYCGKNFADPSAFARHIRTHTGDKRYKCDECPMSFTDASGLIAHKRRHTGIKNYKCEICNKRFYTNADVKKHLDSIHVRRYSYECDYCAKRFVLKAYLRSHLENSGVHSRSKCELCSRVFANVFQKNNHMKIHKMLEFEDYKCDICGESFDRKASIAKHFKMEHNV